MGRLEGAAALVTGGSSGIGLAVAERFLAEGARVVVTGRDERLGREAQERLRAIGEAWFVAADTAEEAAVERSVAEAAERLGGIDTLVANAGVALTARLLDTPASDFDRLMAVNLRGPFLYARAAYPQLARRRGSMVHIGSDAGLLGEQAIGAYSVSKAALVMMTKMLALDGAADGVRSNCICPGTTLPGMRHIVTPGRGEQADDPASWPLPPIGRVGRAEDVAAAAVYLASAEAAFCSGAVLLLDGAMGAGLPA